MMEQKVCLESIMEQLLRSKVKILKKSTFTVVHTFSTYIYLQHAVFNQCAS